MSDNGGKDKSKKNQVMRVASGETIYEMIEMIQAVSRLPLHARLSEMARGGFSVLHFLEQNEGVAYPADLCEDMDVSKARVSMALHMLGEKGLIVKEEDEKDKRRIRIRITEEGIRYMQKSRLEVYENAKAIFSHLGERDAREYIRLMKRMVELSGGDSRSSRRASADGG